MTTFQPFPTLDRGTGTPEDVLTRTIHFCHRVEQWKATFVAQLEAEIKNKDDLNRVKLQDFKDFNSLDLTIRFNNAVKIGSEISTKLGFSEEEIIEICLEDDASRIDVLFIVKKARKEVIEDILEAFNE